MTDVTDDEEAAVSLITLALGLRAKSPAERRFVSEQMGEIADQVLDDELAADGVLILLAATAAEFLEAHADCIHVEPEQLLQAWAQGRANARERWRREGPAEA